MILGSPEPPGSEPRDPFARSLLQANWEDPWSPIAFRSDLEWDDLKGARLFLNCRILLVGLASQGGVASTARGNLKREFANRMFDEMDMDPLHREVIETNRKSAWPEQELWFVHQARLICQSAGLLVKDAGKFHASSLARKWLTEEQSGMLFRQLFIGYFRRFDWRKQRFVHWVPSLHSTMAFTLWRMRQVCGAGTTLGSLAEKVLLPGPLADLRAASRKGQEQEFVFNENVTRPLTELGLVTDERPADARPGIGDHIIRLTHLWHDFICFWGIKGRP